MCTDSLRTPYDFTKKKIKIIIWEIDQQNSSHITSKLHINIHHTFYRPLPVMRSGIVRRKKKEGLREIMKRRLRF